MPSVLSPYDHDHENEVTLFARTNFRNQERKFGIKTDDRRKHIYVIGKTGMGKTTLLENFVLADIYAGHGVCYIDPHGDTAQKLLDYIPSNRINDVVYFNPSDLDNPIGFNILESTNETQKHLIASGLMGVFKKIWPDVWSPRMEYILLNSVLALLDAPGSTLLGINRLLADAEYRKRVVSLIQDPVVKTFWVKEFASWQDKYRTEAIAPVQNKVGQFLSASVIRNIVAQVKSTINVREMMDNRKIFIVNLSKGMVGEENMRLLGGMLITKMQMAAMERVDMPEKDRQDFFLYVDEFQNFANESFASILSEARKYRLALTVAHQYVEQMDEVTRAAIFGNVGTLICFRIGAMDSELLSQEFMPIFTPEDLVGLGKFDIYLKLMINGAASNPFSATTLAPIANRTGSEAKVIKVSRERYSRPRSKIEDKVVRWSGLAPGEDEEDDAANDILAAAQELGLGEERLEQLREKSPKIKEPPKPEGKAKKEALFEIPCAVCGEMQKLTFEPDWTKPWYCKNHLDQRGAVSAAPPPITVLPRVQSELPPIKVMPTAPVKQEPKSSVTPPRAVSSGDKPSARPGTQPTVRRPEGQARLSSQKPAKRNTPRIVREKRPDARPASAASSEPVAIVGDKEEGVSLSALVAKDSGADDSHSPAGYGSMQRGSGYKNDNQAVGREAPSGNSREARNLETENETAMSDADERSSSGQGTGDKNSGVDIPKKPPDEGPKPFHPGQVIKF